MKLFKMLIFMGILLSFLSAATFPVDIRLCRTSGTRIDLTGWFNQNRAYGLHRAFDLPLLQGTPVRAYETSEVEIGYDYPKYDSKLKMWRSGYGNYIKIKVYEKKSTLLGEIKVLKNQYIYGHLDKINGLKDGNTVGEGDTIGFVGSTGIVDASGRPQQAFHLHFEAQDAHGNKINIVKELGDLVKQYYGVDQVYSFNTIGGGSNNN